MKELYFLFALFIAFFAYLPFEIPSSIGNAGARMLLSFILYAIFTIYRHYYQELSRRTGALPTGIMKNMVSVISIAVPVVIIVEDKDAATQQMGFFNIPFLVALYIVSLDLNEKIQPAIVRSFLKRSKSSGGGMFLSFPPASVFDIIVPLFFYAFLAMTFWLIQ